MRNPHICPQCGSQASAFAAGCAICGAPLDPRRAQGRGTAWQRARSAWLARPRPLARVAVPLRRS
jgi:predicted amidophosphoribosyltransferase